MSILKPIERDSMDIVPTRLAFLHRQPGVRNGAVLSHQLLRRLQIPSSEVTIEQDPVNNLDICDLEYLRRLDCEADRLHASAISGIPSASPCAVISDTYCPSIIWQSMSEFHGPSATIRLHIGRGQARRKNYSHGNRQCVEDIESKCRPVDDRRTSRT